LACVVVHFNPPNLAKRLARLSGHASRPLCAFVADLDRRPSEGGSVAVQLRRYASTRSVPIVFAGGRLLGAPDGFGKALRRAELVEEGPAQLVMLFPPTSLTSIGTSAGPRPRSRQAGRSGSAGRRTPRVSSPTSTNARYAATRWTAASSTSRSPQSTPRGRAYASPARSRNASKRHMSGAWHRHARFDMSVSRERDS
jgi:hypothetical protein